MSKIRIPQIQSYQLTNIATIQTGRRQMGSHSKSIQSPVLAIPLISKKLNFVQRYIRQFGDRTQRTDPLRKQSNNILSQRQSMNRSISPSDDQDGIREFHLDVQIVQQNPKEQSIKERCIKYSSINNRRSQERLEQLGKMEIQYLRLKQKAHLPNILPSVNKKQDQAGNTISHQQVQRQIKKSIITKGGQRYFADLYLMKKGRDKIITSLSTVGKHTLNSKDHTYEELIKNSRSYEKEVAESKQQFVQKKILGDRNAKREKMIRGRSMNWNVYYDIHALSPKERGRLKAQKFKADYGIC